MPIAYLALGSDLPPQLDFLKGGIYKIQNRFFVSGVSSVYKTKPYQMVSENFFLNCCIRVEVPLPNPEDLLLFLQEIEHFYGRNPHRNPSKKLDRNLDIDILLFGEKTFNTSRLTIPHPQMIFRDFCLVPLLELDPHLSEPVSQRKYQDFLQKISSDERTILEKRSEFLEN